MAIDQATRAVLAAMAPLGPLHARTPEQIRSAPSSPNPGPVPAMHAVTEHTIPSTGAGITVRVLVPSAASRGTIVYFHGGGWVLGDLDGFDPVGRALAATTDMTVVMVDYRLAPEHRFPAAVEDARAAVRWAASGGVGAGSPGPLVLAGDSAGANLAIVTALHARADGPKIAATALVYPITDCDLDRPSYLDPDNQLLISRDTMAWFFGHYVGEQDPTIPDVSPLRADDLAGFPLTVLALAEHDPLRDEGEAFADRLVEAGVPVERRLFEGQMHGFFQMLNILPGSADAVGWLADRLRAHLLQTPVESA